ncbi:hypothetical protein Bca4012_084332 [Brassica carinata]
MKRARSGGASGAVEPTGIRVSLTRRAVLRSLNTPQEEVASKTRSFDNMKSEAKTCSLKMIEASLMKQTSVKLWSNKNDEEKTNDESLDESSTVKTSQDTWRSIAQDRINLLLREKDGKLRLYRTQTSIISSASECIS